MSEFSLTYGSAATKQLIERAELRIEQMDAIDGSCVTDGTFESAMRTVILAMHCGIETNSWDAVADALVMVRQIHTKLMEDNTGPRR